MKLFLDTANLADIEEAFQSGYIEGVTTNPSLLAKEPKGNYLAHMKKIVALCKKYSKTASLSVEVFATDKKEMVKQAVEFSKALKYKHLAIKIPISYKGENYLSVIRELSDRGIIVNATACMTPMQLVSAAASGAQFVSLFYNRVRDGATEEKYDAERTKLEMEGVIEQNDYDPNSVLVETTDLLIDYPKARIIAGSIRTPLDVKYAGLAGADIVTASPAIFKKMFGHYKTDHAVGQFLADFSAWMK
ncbi:MAG: transaldolase family protein [Patescibacteria group bacterium]